jgi:hypothetical protein
MTVKTPHHKAVGSRERKERSSQVRAVHKRRVVSISIESG